MSFATRRGSRVKALWWAGPSRWLAGSGQAARPVTAGQVLRKADALGAGAAVGVDVPPRLRTMADIPALHRPWCVAVAVGLI